MVAKRLWSCFALTIEAASSSRAPTLALKGSDLMCTIGWIRVRSSLIALTALLACDGATMRPPLRQHVVECFQAGIFLLELDLNNYIAVK